MTDEHSPQSGFSLRQVPDEVLLRRLADLVGQSRRVEVELVAHIAEVDARRLYAREACASMFAYCTERLHLSETEAYLRITAARASREHPVLLEMLADGRLHLSGIERLAPHLTASNREGVLQRATHRTKRQIEELVAGLSPRPDVPATIRKLPVRRPAIAAEGAPALGISKGILRPERGGALRPDGVATGAPAQRPARFEPTAPGRYKVQFTASAALRDKLERLQAMMRRSRPDADLATAIEDAVTEKLQRLEARRLAATSRPRRRLCDSDGRTSSSRHVPAAVKRAVRARDKDQCCYVDGAGRRCTARRRLEFHHRQPYGYGGPHGVDNVCLMCRTHNALIAEVDYGERRRANRRTRHLSDGAPVARGSGLEL